MDPVYISNRSIKDFKTLYLIEFVFGKAVQSFVFIWIRNNHNKLVKKFKKATVETLYEENIKKIENRVFQEILNCGTMTPTESDVVNEFVVDVCMKYFFENTPLGRNNNEINKTYSKEHSMMSLFRFECIFLNKYPYKIHSDLLLPKYITTDALKLIIK